MSTKVTLNGRVGNDPDLRFSPKGIAVTSFSVVTSQRYKDEASGEWKDKNTSWWRVTTFGQLAQNCAESLAKGTSVIVEGNAFEEEWTDRDGNQRKSMKVLADDVAPSLRWASAKIVKADRAAARLASEPGGESRWDTEAPF